MSDSQGPSLTNVAGQTEVDEATDLAQAFATSATATYDGPWPLVLWRPAADHLCAAVDALGRFELYWTRTHDRLWLADDPAPLLALPDVHGSLDETALANHLVGYAWEESRTPFLAVRRLPAGHRLDAHAGGGVTVRRWWDPRPEAIGAVLEREPIEALAEHWRTALVGALDGRLPSTRAPRAASETDSGAVGILLSGGLDSGALAGILRARRPGETLWAGSHVFPTLATCDESHWSRTIAAATGLRHRLLSAEDHLLLDEPAAYVPSLAEPFCAWATADRALLGLLASAGVRTVLSGHGGDLLIGGSTLALSSRLRRGDPRAISEAWRDSERRARRTSLPRWTWDQGVAPLLSDRMDATLRAVARPLRLTHGGYVGHTKHAEPQGRPVGVPPWIGSRLARDSGLADGRPARPPAPRVYADPARQALYAALRHPGAVNRAVRWLDRVARPLGITMEHPYLDRHLAELALRLPPSACYSAGRRKGVHRRALEGLLPPAVLARDDKGNLSAYHDTSLRRPQAQAWINDLLAAPIAAEMGLVDLQGLHQLRARFNAGAGGPVGDALWAAITLELWLRAHHA